MSLVMSNHARMAASAARPLMAVLVLLCGCEPPKVTWSDPLGVTSRKTLDTRSVAAGLGMTIEHVSRTSATLRRGCESVTLYSDPVGQVYVNGQALADSGGIEAAEGTLHVPTPLVRRISSALGPETPRLTETYPRPPLVVPEPIRPTPRPAPRLLGRVVLDPGHGGKDPGAISASGIREKDVVLSVAAMTAQELRARGVEVFFTRSDDRFIELEDRPVVASRVRADLFVSIHADAARNKAATGFTAYVDRTPSRQSLAAANAMIKAMCAYSSPSRGVKNADYKVLVGSSGPAVLIELGFLSNRHEASRLARSDHQRRLARALADGICAYLR